MRLSIYSQIKSSHSGYRDQEIRILSIQLRKFPQWISRSRDQDNEYPTQKFPQWISRSRDQDNEYPTQKFPQWISRSRDQDNEYPTQKFPQWISRSRDQDNEYPTQSSHSGYRDQEIRIMSIQLRVPTVDIEIKRSG